MLRYCTYNMGRDTFIAQSSLLMLKQRVHWLSYRLQNDYNEVQPFKTVTVREERTLEQKHSNCVGLRCESLRFCTEVCINLHHRSNRHPLPTRSCCDVAFVTSHGSTGLTSTVVCPFHHRRSIRQPHLHYRRHLARKPHPLRSCCHPNRPKNIMDSRHNM